jgi:hypothetical protein
MLQTIYKQLSKAYSRWHIHWDAEAYGREEAIRPP